MRSLKIGAILRADNCGLGIESQEFVEHFKIEKVLIVDCRYPLHIERFKKPSIVRNPPTGKEIREFLNGLDLVICFETPYNWSVFRTARELGVKSILRINYEWLENPLPDRPDLFISPSLWFYDRIPEPKVYLPFPVNREKLPFKKRKIAKTFIHIAGNGKAVYDRNGTELFLQAIKFVRSENVRFIIKCQRVYYKWVFDEFKNDDRVKIEVDDKKNYWEIWDDADVYVSPRRYGGQSLPLNEAMSLGIVPIMSDMSPQNKFLPKKLLIEPDEILPLKIKREIEIATIRPIRIAEKIDELAGQDISYYSELVGKIANEWSWKKLLPKYNKLFLEICQKRIT